MRFELFIVNNLTCEGAFDYREADRMAAQREPRITQVPQVPQVA